LIASVEEAKHYKKLLRTQLGIEVISITQPLGADVNDPASFLSESVHEIFDEYYKPGRPSPKYVLRGLARCRRCHANMQGTSGGRDLKARYYCATRRANRSCDQPIIPAEQVEQQLAQFLTDFAPNEATQAEILHRLSNPTSTREDSQTTEHGAALEERLGRMRDLYELGDLHRTEYVARRDAINAELSALTPAPIPDLDQAQAVLEDFTIFWQDEADPSAKRQFLSLIFENVWLDQDRVVAVQPKPPFLPFFQRNRRPTTQETAGVKYGSDGTRTRDLCRDRAAL
jgi:hypothetical protein